MNEYNNVPVKKIGLKQWYKDHPSKPDMPKASSSCNAFYTPTQEAHLKGEINVYEPIEAYDIKWYHKGNNYYPIMQSKKRNDLPPIYIQWKDDFRKRNARTKPNN